MAVSKNVHHIQRSQLIHFPRLAKSLGPISLLPTEVLANIFLYCLSEDCDADIRAAPLVLTQVCSSWRKVCLRISQLWSNLNLTLTTTSPKLPRASPFSPTPSTSSPTSGAASSTRSPQALANLASLWFERARNQLLSVSVKLNAPYITSTVHENASDVSSICQPILSNARAIQHLSIHVTCASQLREFFTTSNADFINLRSLSLSIQHIDISSVTALGPITVFQNSPRLSRVSFKLNGCPPSRSLINLPWANIEEFEMAGASLLPADSFQSLLASCTGLRKASFWVEDAFDHHHHHHHRSNSNSDTSSSFSSATRGPICLPNLSHLSISFYGRHAKTASSLLTPFSLPQLQHFHFFSGFITLPFLPAAANSTASTPQNLQSLVASGVDISAAEFSALVARNPSLRSLTLDLRYFTRDHVSSTLDVLATERHRALPCLSNLSLWTQDISSHSAAYLRMVHSRGKKNTSSSTITDDNGDLHFSLFLARQHHGACCHFSTCTASTSNGHTSLDHILTLADACEKADGVIFYLKDVNPGDGIEEIS